MYAYTDTSYRAINEARDAAEGERVADEIPEATLLEIRKTLTRFEISNRISSTNWAMVEDADITALEKAAIRTYRAALRALTNHPDYPNMAWPQLPGTSGIGNETGEQS